LDVKTVRFAGAAAIGLTPLVALGVPSAAQAAPAQHGAMASGKTKMVSGHPLLPASDHNKCAGQTYEWTAAGSPPVKLDLYKANHGTDSTCVGTVGTSLNTEGVQVYTPSIVYFWIYSQSTNPVSAPQPVRPAHTGNTYYANTAVRDYWRNPVRVCAQWSNGFTYGIVDETTCIKLG
jgi:hypothetical protein